MTDEPTTDTPRSESSRYLAERLRMRRESHGWTTRDLAKAAGISHTIVFGIENGRDCVTRTLICLAGALGVTVDDLIVAPEERIPQALSKAVYEVRVYSGGTSQVRVRQPRHDILSTWRELEFWWLDEVGTRAAVAVLRQVKTV